MNISKFIQKPIMLLFFMLLTLCIFTGNVNSDTVTSIYDASSKGDSYLIKVTSSREEEGLIIISEIKEKPPVTAQASQGNYHFSQASGQPRVRICFQQETEDYLKYRIENWTEGNRQFYLPHHMTKASPVFIDYAYAISYDLLNDLAKSDGEFFDGNSLYHSIILPSEPLRISAEALADFLTAAGQIDALDELRRRSRQASDRDIYFLTGLEIYQVRATSQNSANTLFHLRGEIPVYADYIHPGHVCAYVTMLPVTAVVRVNPDNRTQLESLYSDDQTTLSLTRVRLEDTESEAHRFAETIWAQVRIRRAAQDLRRGIYHLRNTGGWQDDLNRRSTLENIPAPAAFGVKGFGDLQGS